MSDQFDFEPRLMFLLSKKFGDVSGASRRAAINAMKK
jgi:hypothetical protein